MAIPSTGTVSPIFTTTGPAWEAGVTLAQNMVSDVSTSRSGLEQRQQRSARGRWKITYVAKLNQTERSARERRARAEVVSPVWVPFWTEAGLTATAIVANTFSMDREWSLDFFSPGDWVLFDSPTQGQQFRQIDSIGITAQELVLVAMTGAIAFDPLTRIFPCRLCTRDNGGAEFQAASEITHTERLTYSTL